MKKAGKQAAVEVMTLRGLQEPRLRFDRTAVGFVKRLQATLAGSVSEGKTVIATITAPIRQDSKTGVVLGDKIRKLLATGRARLKGTIHGNRIEVRVLKGGSARTSRVIGFVHNPRPGPAALFEVTRAMLACSKPRSLKRGRWLVVANQDGRAPIEAVQQVYRALRGGRVFQRILVAEREGLRVLS